MGCGVKQTQQHALGQLLGGPGCDWGSLETHPNHWQLIYRGEVCSGYEKVWEILLALRKFLVYLCWHHRTVLYVLVPL